MKQLLWHQLILVVVAGAVFFTNLGATGLFDLDEALFASCSREMLAHDDWIVPRYNNEVFYDKPPLMYWLMMASFKTLGASEWAARLPMAILALVTVLATYHIGRRLFRPEVGLWAGLIVASTIIFTVSARAATVDAALACFTSLAMLAYVLKAFPEGAAGAVDGGRWSVVGGNTLRFLPASEWVYAVVGAFLGVAVLGKGPVGLLLPTLALLAFLLIENAPTVERNEQPGDTSWKAWFHWILRQGWATFRPQQVFRLVRAMRPPVALSAAAVVALPWYLLVTLQTHGEWLEQFVYKYNLGPFVKPFLGHRGPIYYHFVVIFIGLFPWSVFLGPTLVQFVRGIRRENVARPAYVLLACWIVAFFGFWSLCSTKLPHYVLPAYPPLAILIACFIQAWRDQPAAFSRWWPRLILGSLAFVGLAMTIALPWAAARYAPGEEVIALVGVVLLVGGGVGLVLLKLGRLRAVMPVCALTSIAFIVSMFAWALVRIDRHQHSKPLMAAMETDSRENDSHGTPELAGFRFLQASTVFYAGGPVPEFGSTAAIKDFIARSPQPYIITTSEYLPELEHEWPGGFRAVAKRPQFLSKGKTPVDVVVVAPTAMMRLAQRSVVRRE